VFSPDGNWIAFVRSDDNSGKSSIIKIRLDGSGETVVLTIENAKYLNLAWSPDGNWIAFSLRQNGDYDIYLIRPDGNDLVMVTNDSNIDRQPRWLVINEP
jgi:TolB protein